MSKKIKRIWLAIEEQTHANVIEMAIADDRTIHGQYRRLITLGLEQQLAANRKAFGSKKLLRELHEKDGAKSA